MQGAGVVNDSDASAVVAPVFETFQPLVDDGPGFLLANVSNYAAHYVYLAVKV
jgi:hypothetical protein